MALAFFFDQHPVCKKLLAVRLSGGEQQEEDIVRLLYIAGLTYIAISVLALMKRPSAMTAPFNVTITAGPVTPVTPTGQGSTGAEWFALAKPSCNTLEVETFHRRQPPPSSMDGRGYSAACWALAGRITEARNAILQVDDGQRWTAVGIVFNIGHPIADMGDDLSAGPIMELVVEFWPNHYMALYHAGAARYALGEYGAAGKHLEAFLQHYKMNDGWTSSARSMLTEIGR